MMQKLTSLLVSLAFADDGQNDRSAHFSGSSLKSTMPEMLFNWHIQGYRISLRSIEGKDMNQRNL